ncbi:hypothetical protein [Spirosoma oryzicola]|uniref:hypothetical protein n=1 Tax=Spirosoma oryzicola TaxID=2898794 RepID=UPI001E3DCA1F|nr:hypothetical protein [Spirosoma oryzicola]UHG93816.1 hypothetical protein LQ777_25170 [Spirosoma oryzicola]
MRLFIKLALLAVPLLYTQCGINRQVQQAKGLGKSRYAVHSADNVTLAGYEVSEFKEINRLEDLNPVNYPRLAAGLLSKDIPFKADINLEIVNPTRDTAAINQFEYRLLLSGNELATGTVDQRVVVPPGGGKTLVPIPVNTNVYGLMASRSSRKSFVDLIRNLAGSQRSSPSRITLKIKPTFLVGNKQIKYPGYIDIDKDISKDMLLKK